VADPDAGALVGSDDRIAIYLGRGDRRQRRLRFTARGQREQHDATQQCANPFHEVLPEALYPAIPTFQHCYGRLQSLQRVRIS